MKYLQRVVWAKGMLLTPQHFQAHSNHIEDLLQFRFTASNFANWGVADLKLDLEALAQGNLVVTRLVGILPDGTLLECPSTDPAPSLRPFAVHFPQNDDLLDVFLGVATRLDGHNVGMDPNQESGGTGNHRFWAKDREVPDENGIDKAQTVQFAQRNLAILFGNQGKDGYIRLRIAQVRKTSTGFELNPDFIPPLVNIAASAALMELLKRQVEVLGQKAQSLSNSLGQPGGAAAFNLNQFQSSWLLQTVNSFQPELAHIWNVRRGHPEALFVCMLRLAGALASLSRADVRSFPAYNHDDLGTCFRALDVRIHGLLEAALPSKCIAIPLKQSQHLWAGTFADDSWLKNTQLYLAVSANIGVDDLIRKVPRLVRVAPPDEIERIVKHALPGMTLRHLNPPSDIPYRVENQYFALNQSGRLWEEVAKSRQIRLFLPPELVGARAELYVLLP